MMLRVLVAGSLLGALPSTAIVLGQTDEALPTASRTAQSVERFIAFCQHHLAQSGAVVAYYEDEDDGAPRVAVGLDSATRAWFVCTTSACAGRTAAGESYRGSIEGGIQVQRGSTAGGSPLGVAEYLPAGFLYHLSERPEVIREASETADGGWIVAYAQEGQTPRPLARVSINGTGRVTRFWVDDPVDPRQREFEYSDTGGPLEAAKYAGARARKHLEDVEVFGKEARAAFSVERVEQILRDLHIQEDTIQEAKRHGFTRNDEGAWEAPSQEAPLRYGGEGILMWRWPLALAGTTLAVLAGVEIWRRRR